MSEPLRKISIYPFLMIGLVVGALLALFIAQSSLGFLNIFPAYANASLRDLFYFWAGLYGLMFLLAYPDAQSLPKLISITVIPSFLASLVYYWMFKNIPYQLSLLLFSSCTLNAFHINYQANNFRLCYPTLFHAVWDTLIKIIISIFFTLLCWLLVFACAKLFEFIGITFIIKLIDKSWFDVWITAIFMSIGLYIPSSMENIVHIIRMILLHICRYLFIPLAIVSIIFIVAFFTLPHQQHFKSSSETIFLSIAYACVLLFNGVYQDGSNDSPYPIVLMWISRVFLWITPIFSSLALYSEYYYSHNNISHAGFNTSNFFDFITTILLLIYTVTYALIALNIKKTWQRPIKRSNIVLAIIVVIVTLVTTQPLVTRHLPKRDIYTNFIPHSS